MYISFESCEKKKHHCTPTTNENSFWTMYFFFSPFSTEYSMLFLSTFCCCCFFSIYAAAVFCCCFYCLFSLSIFIEITILVCLRWFAFTVDGKKNEIGIKIEEKKKLCIMFIMFFNSLAIFQGNKYQRCLDLLPIWRKKNVFYSLSFSIHRRLVLFVSYSMSSLMSYKGRGWMKKEKSTHKNTTKKNGELLFRKHKLIREKIIQCAWVCDLRPRYQMFNAPFDFTFCSDVYTIFIFILIK